MARYTTAAMQGVIEAARANGWRGRKPTIGMRICAIIDTEAQRRGVTPKEFVTRAGVHVGIYHKWRGAETAPTIRLIERLETAGLELF